MASVESQYWKDGGEQWSADDESNNGWVLLEEMLLHSSICLFLPEGIPLVASEALSSSLSATDLSDNSCPSLLVITVFKKS